MDKVHSVTFFGSAVQKANLETKTAMSRENRDYNQKLPANFARADLLSKQDEKPNNLCLFGSKDKYQ